MIKNINNDYYINFLNTSSFEECLSFHKKYLMFLNNTKDENDFIYEFKNYNINKSKYLLSLDYNIDSRNNIKEVVSFSLIMNVSSLYYNYMNSIIFCKNKSNINTFENTDRFMKDLCIDVKEFHLKDELSLEMKFRKDTVKKIKI